MTRGHWIAVLVRVDIYWLGLQYVLYEHSHWQEPESIDISEHRLSW